MRTMWNVQSISDWLISNWLSVAIPVLAFLATLVVGLWLRRAINKFFQRWSSKTHWDGSGIVSGAIYSQFLTWFLLFGIEIALEISVLPAGVKRTIGMTIGSLLVVSFTWLLIIILEGLFRLYLPRIRTPEHSTTIINNIVRVLMIVVGVLIIFDIWGVPTTPVIILILVAAVVAVILFQTAAPNLFAGFQLSANQQVKVGDYIKLETGEEGYVTEISWSHTSIKAINESIVMVPNSRFLQHTVINYGRPLKKAKEPFYFMSRTYLKELTGLKAKNLPELVDILKNAPDSVVDYHTHRFLEEHNYLTPEPANDFAVWIDDVLSDEVLGERIASIDTFSFQNLGALKERIVNTIEEYIASRSENRQAMEGREFYFIKSINVVMPTPYVVHDLREFVEALRKLSAGSLYFHIFESRLRSGRGLNDFSIWLKDNLDEVELGDEIARLDPYTYTLEGLRSILIQFIEKRIK
jgi:small-conductance mechanosensitive channel